MLIHASLYSYINVHLSIQRFCGTCPFLIKQTQKLATSSRKSLEYEFCKNILFTLYVFIIFSQLFHEWGDIQVVISLESLLCVLGDFTCCFTKWVIYYRRKNVIELFNLFIQFEKRHFQGEFWI